MMQCSNCREDFELNQPGHFQLDYTLENRCDVFCSVSCLTEFACRLSEPVISRCESCGPMLQPVFRYGGTYWCQACMDTEGWTEEPFDG